MKKGMVYVFTGEGKGKTSAALGVVVRMLLCEKKVTWIAWYKSEDWPTSEMRLKEIFPSRLEMYWLGEGFFVDNAVVDKDGVRYARVNKGRIVDKVTAADHKKAARQGLCLAEKILKRKDKPDLLVMDEVLQAVRDGLLEESEVAQVLDRREQTHVVLTGRGAGESWIGTADLITRMDKVLHPYDRGEVAVKGLDF